MKASIKIATMFATVVLVFGLTACSGGDGNTVGGSNGSESSSSASNTEITDSAAASDQVADGSYVEIDGERMSTEDWSSMLVSDPRSIDNYIGRQITVVADFSMVSNSDQFYYPSYEASKATDDTPLTYEAPIGMMILGDTIYVDISEADSSLVSGLEPGDRVRVTGTVSGFFVNETLLLPPSSGAEHTGDITIEALWR